MPSVVVRPWVITDVSSAVMPFRNALDRVLFDLNNHLPNNLSQYQPNRIAGTPACFWYSRIYSLDPHIINLRQLNFVVRDTNQAILEVIWVTVG